MFEGEERWSRNAGSGIGLSNYKNVYRDNILVGNWQEDQYGKILPDRTNEVNKQPHPGTLGSTGILILHLAFLFWCCVCFYSLSAP